MPYYVSKEFLDEAERRKNLLLEFLEANPYYEWPNSFAHRILLDNAIFIIWLDDNFKLWLTGLGGDPFWYPRYPRYTIEQPDWYEEEFGTRWRFI